MTGALAGRTAVVTGASRGIGLAIARTLAAAGARVALVARDSAALARIAGDLGERAIAEPCDVTDHDAVRGTTARLVESFGGAPSILVNNAGRFTLAPAHELTPDEFAAALDVNVTAPFLFVRAFLPDMRRRGTGHLVTVGSIADHEAFSGNAAYAASKFGVRGLHEVLRAELRGTGVHATLISPGPTDTALWDAVNPDARDGFTPRAAMLRPSAVADAVLFAVTREPAVNVDEIRLGPG